ncbi:hypothetical protein RJ640_015610 [Escallonia rubra]|uniref:Uncharacterized protein n=1 Tax=Escallonia rubra TaxID=112253 RepID=A0AA88S9Y0_9ASTE|nr:hypothetical protein RJ640_015610 [Escallonia rubra]
MLGGTTPFLTNPLSSREIIKSTGEEEEYSSQAAYCCSVHVDSSQTEALLRMKNIRPYENVSLWEFQSALFGPTLISRKPSPCPVRHTVGHAYVVPGPIERVEWE